VESLANWYSDAQFDGSAPSAKLEIHDPSSGSFLANVPICSSEVVEQAVARARKAQPPWAELRPEQRAALLFEIADRVDAISAGLSELLALETGKSLETECRGEVALLSQIFRYFAGVCHEIKGHTVDFGHKILGFVTHHPVGVVAGIVPWNVPLMLMSYKVAAPLIAGNTVVIKMPEQATHSLIAVYQIVREVLPKGVCEFLSGDGATTGEALIQSRGIDKVSFTGSVETGRHVYEQSAKLIRPVTLELGGKSPMIVLDDCDIDKAVDGIFGSMRFTRAGQSCTAASRVFLTSRNITQVQEQLIERLNGVTIGPALDPQTQCGPLVTRKQRDRVTRYLDEAKADGIQITACGKVLPGTPWDQGFYVKPHVVLNPPDAHTIATEEVFGPVVCLLEYTQLDEAIERANDSKFGLSASVWGKDISDCMNTAAKLNAGIVQINQNAIMLPGLAYGGIKDSGIGRESSVEAMVSTYMYSKTNILNYNQGPSD